MSEPSSSWRSRLAAPAFGVGATAAGLLLACLSLASRPRSDGGC